MFTRLVFLSMRCVLSFQFRCNISDRCHRVGHLRAQAAANNLMEGIVPDRPEDGFSDSLWTIMQKCLQVKRAKRPTANDVLSGLDKVLRA